VSEWWEKVVVGGRDDCWLWQASVDSKGYPQINRRGKVLRVHRLAAEEAHGPLTGPVHHSCENRRCLNPAHLVPMSSTREHLQHHLATRCKRGHDLTDPANVAILRRGERRCRKCHVIRNVKSQRKRRQERRMMV